MSEEEKQAIEILKQEPDFSLSYYKREKAIDIVLNLIDKQQKEIEELKQITQNYNAIGGETFGDDRIIVCSMKYFDDGVFKRNFISKDKIRDFIQQEIENEEYLEDDIDTDIELASYDKYINSKKLEKLLEGE